MNYLQITHEDVCNGVGLRVVLWLSGCSHQCLNCQNPQTWNPDNGALFDKLAEQEIFTELSKDYISGLTLTGGDPLYKTNLNEVLSLINLIRTLFPEKTIWLYTGYTIQLCNVPYVDVDNDFEITSRSFLAVTKPSKDTKVNLIREAIINDVDVLVDGEYMDEQRDVTLKWRGSKNQRVIDVKKSLAQHEIVLYCD